MSVSVCTENALRESERRYSEDSKLTVRPGLPGEQVKVGPNFWVSFVWNFVHSLKTAFSAAFSAAFSVNWKQCFTPLLAKIRNLGFTIESVIWFRKTNLDKEQTDEEAGASFALEMFCCASWREKEWRIGLYDVCRFLALRQDSRERGTLAFGENLEELRRDNADGKQTEMISRNLLVFEDAALLINCVPSRFTFTVD